MKLTWQPIDNDGNAAGKPVVLALSSPRRGPGSKIVLESSWLHARLTETVTYPRAAEADQFERGNVQTTFAALVHCEFASYRECSQWCARLGNLLSGRGNLSVAYEEGGVDVLPRAVWQQIPVPAKLGLAVTINFTFTGGAVN